MKLSLKCLSLAAAPFTACALLVALPGGAGLPATSYAQATDDSFTVLTRGPVHEAFAGTISFKAVAGLPVPQGPPEPVDELPPELRPEGANVTWISGYWAWDEDATEFIWVSGIWRNLPPGRQWIPGYWWESGRDFQWVSGYWADAAVEEIEYLDAPPASLEKGPNMKAPSRNHSWVPGSWRYRNNKYAWQGGYWDEPRPNWNWVPSYYTSTPRGYIYVDGYYDYDVPRRGVIFAPVRFQGQRYAQPNYRYQPASVISITAVVNHLFLRPKARHYYFGDYYAPEYRKTGYYSSSNYYTGGQGYDPIYAQRRWTHREDTSWERREEENFTYYREHEEERPPHTLAAFNQYYERPDRNRRIEENYVSRLDELVTRRDSTIKFRAVEQSEQEVFTRRSRELRDYGEERRKSVIGIEARVDNERPENGKRRQQDGPRAEPVRIKMERSPVLAPEVSTAAASDAPPPRPAGAPVEEAPAKSQDPVAPGRGAPGRDPDTGKLTPPGQKPNGEPAPVPGGEKEAPLNPDGSRRDMDKNPKGPPGADPKPGPVNDPTNPAPDKPNANPDKKDPAAPPAGPDNKPPGDKPGGKPDRDPNDPAAAPPAMPAGPKRGDPSPQDPAAPKPDAAPKPKTNPDGDATPDKPKGKPNTDQPGKPGDESKPMPTPGPQPRNPDATPGKNDTPEGRPPRPNADPRGGEGQGQDRKRDTPKPPKEDKATPEPRPQIPSPEPRPEPRPKMPAPDAGPDTKPMPNPDAQPRRPDRESPAADGRKASPRADPRREAPTPAPAPEPRRESPAPEQRRDPSKGENRRDKQRAESRPEQPGEPKAQPRQETPPPQPRPDNNPDRQPKQRREAPQPAPSAEPGRPPQRDPKAQPPREERSRPQADPAPQARPQGPPPSAPDAEEGAPGQKREKRKKD